MGTLTKQIYRYTHKRNMRHNENLWPFVKIHRKNTGEISTFHYRGRPIKIADLSALRDAFSGHVLLTATGPSIKEIDFSQRPKDIKTVGVNGAWHLQEHLDFSFYFIVDMTFIDHHISIIKEICKTQSITLFTTVMGLVKILELSGNDKIVCQIAIIEDICYQTYKPSVKREQISATFDSDSEVILSKTDPNIAFSTDIRKGIFDAGTVIYWALQALGYMGFEHIYIAGLDLNNLSKPRFYESESSMRPSYLHDKLRDLVFPALKLASEVLDDKGIEIVNLSKKSAVPDTTFVKQEFQDLGK